MSQADPNAAAAAAAPNAVPVEAPTPAAAVAQPVPLRLPWEEWAARKAHVKPDAKRPWIVGDAWMAAAARGLRNWAIGAEVTEAEYDDAVYHATHDRIG